MKSKTVKKVETNGQKINDEKRREELKEGKEA